jgi:MFS family permease
VALGSVFTVYLLGVVVTPLAGRWIGRIGYRGSVVAALAISGTGLMLTLVPVLSIAIVGLAITAAGIFVAHAAAASHIGVAAGEGRSSAVGLYVAFYYAGGSAGGVIPGLFWEEAGWGGTVALVLGVQIATALVALVWWRGRRDS